MARSVKEQARTDAPGATPRRNTPPRPHQPGDARGGCGRGHPHAHRPIPHRRRGAPPALPFRGVVFDVDPVFDNTEEWYLSIPEEIRPRKDQPFYHLLAENADNEYVAYVSEQKSGAGHVQ